MLNFVLNQMKLCIGVCVKLVLTNAQQTK
jgi:hypothetical protein